jgi:hypothetical protein
LSVRTHEHCIVDYKRAFGAFHHTPKSCESTRKPKVILMKKAGPIASGLTQTEITDGHPVSDSTGSNQPNRKNISKVTHNIESVVRRAIIDNHQLNLVIVLATHALECRGQESLAIVRRHNN